MKRGERPKRCTGPAWREHALGCHPRAPRCKWRRKAHERWKPCNCGAMHYAHRVGSGLCLKGKNVEKQWRHLYGDAAVDAYLAESARKGIESGVEVPF